MTFLVLMTISNFHLYWLIHSTVNRLLWSIISFFYFQSQATPDVNGSVKPSLLVNDQNKYKTMLVRARSSLWMLLGFSLVIYMGHLYICAFVVGIQIIMARELFTLRKQAYEDKKLPGFRILIWYVHSCFRYIILKLVRRCFLATHGFFSPKNFLAYE